MNRDYYSIYAEHIKGFIEMKHKLGFKYWTGAVNLRQIDQFAQQTEETTPGITKSFADKWGQKRPNESELYRYTRIRHLAQFSSYLRDMGISSYLPKLPPFPKYTCLPYIYSPQQMQAIFNALDGLRLKLGHKNSCLICIPALIRLLYSTGLRIGEALALQEEDVNLKEQYLRVTDSKSGKERIIPISTSLTEVCKTYKNYRDQLPLGQHKSTHFFIRTNGRPCGDQAVRYWFKKCLDKVAITHTGVGYGPRIHDLRHTFAVRALASMAEAGLDLYVCLPILSTYLGHQSLASTDHYVRLTANMYPQLIKEVNMVCLDVFPKFKNYEAN